MQIYSKNIYEIMENQIKKSVLIVYNISDNHYVGLPIHSRKLEKSIHIASINKYVKANELKEYSRKNMKRFSICQRYLLKSE